MLAFDAWTDGSGRHIDGMRDVGDKYEMPSVLCPYKVCFSRVEGEHDDGSQCIGCGSRPDRCKGTTKDDEKLDLNALDTNLWTIDAPQTLIEMSWTLSEQVTNHETFGHDTSQAAELLSRISQQLFQTMHYTIERLNQQIDGMPAKIGADFANVILDRRGVNKHNRCPQCGGFGVNALNMWEPGPDRRCAYCGGSGRTDFRWDARKDQE